MAIFLKAFSGVYLLIVWVVFFIAVNRPPPSKEAANLFGYTPEGLIFYTFVLCLFLSVPAVIMYAFGQVVGDVRAMRGHLRAMRAYYEPHP